MRKRTVSLCLMSLACIIFLFLMKTNIYAETRAIEEVSGTIIHDTEIENTEITDTETPDTETPDTETPDVEDPDIETPDKDGEIPEGEEEKDEQEDEEQNEEPEPVIQYEVSYPKPDGNKEYYVKKPYVEISHKSKRGITKYELSCDGKKIEEGKLTNEGGKKKIEPQSFQEGKHKLIIWMEDETGEAVEEYTSNIYFYVDTKNPVLKLHVPKGTDGWHDRAVSIKVEAEDDTSGVREIKCFLDGELIGTKKESNVSFWIDKQSVKGTDVKVRVVVTDGAGNKSEETKILYLDFEKPQITLKGVENYMITSQNIVMECSVSDNNLLKQCFVETSRKNIDGKMILEKREMEIQGESSKIQLKYEKNGIYNIKISAIDRAEHVKEEKIQFIIDKETPIIKNITVLNGRHIRSFCMDCGKNDIVKDFTSYKYEIKIDGKKYKPGQKIDHEGWHTLMIHAEDAAGNRSMKRARFFVDHTRPEIIFQGIEDKKSYDEPKEIVVTTREQDVLEKVTINGVMQKIGTDCKQYSTKVSDVGEYDICVTAKDKAGNYTERRIQFQILKKTLLQTFKRNEEKENEEIVVQKKTEQSEPEDEKNVERKKSYGSLWTIMVIVIFLGSGAGYVFYRMKE